MQPIWCQSGPDRPGLHRPLLGRALHDRLGRGIPLTWSQGGAEITHPDQVVLTYEPYHRLAYTWHTFTPQWAQAVGISEEVRAQLAAERRSHVTFDIEPHGDQVKLTVTHDFDPAGALHSMCSQGWPPILSSLKTLLETGEPLPTSRN